MRVADNSHVLLIQIHQLFMFLSHLFYHLYSLPSPFPFFPHLSSPLSPSPPLLLFCLSSPLSPDTYVCTHAYTSIRFFSPNI